MISSIFGEMQQGNGAITDVLVEEIKNSVDIVSYLESTTGCVLVPQSGGWYLTNCPLPNHSDRSPSFRVNNLKGIFKCFGCTEGGDVIKLCMLLEGVSFAVAMRHLASFAGVILDGSEDAVAEIAARRAVKMLDNSLLGNRTTALPAGMNEAQFLIAIAKRVRQAKARYGVIESVERAVYISLDDALLEHDIATCCRIWDELNEILHEARLHDSILVTAETAEDEEEFDTTIVSY